MLIQYSLCLINSNNYEKSFNYFILLFLVTTPYADNEELGGKIFNNNCAVCHGQNASGPKGDWREKLADGSYPPPPLNGTAHTWHHSPK